MPAEIPVLPTYLGGSLSTLLAAPKTWFTESKKHQSSSSCFHGTQGILWLNDTTPHFLLAEGMLSSFISVTWQGLQSGGFSLQWLLNLNFSSPPKPFRVITHTHMKGRVAMAMKDRKNLWSSSLLFKWLQCPELCRPEVKSQELHFIIYFFMIQFHKHIDSSFLPFSLIIFPPCYYNN